MVIAAATVSLETAVPSANNAAPAAEVAEVARNLWVRVPEKSAIPSNAAAVKAAITANCELSTTCTPTRNAVDITSAVRPAFRSDRCSGSCTGKAICMGHRFSAMGPVEQASAGLGARPEPKPAATAGFGELWLELWLEAAGGIEPPYGALQAPA